MKPSKEAIIISSIGVVFVIIIGILIWKSPSFVGGAKTSVDDQSLLVRPTSQMTGSSTAKATLVEFGDYQCPACGAVYPVLKQITDSYKDNPNFNFVFRNFPLPQHQYAKLSAEAAEAAGAQGKYWEMHDKLYDGQNEWTNSKDVLSVFVGYAESLGLDVNKFKNDIQNNAYQSVIDADLADVGKLGLNHTPTIFLNGEEQTSLDITAIKTKIDALIAN